MANMCVLVSEVAFFVYRGKGVEKIKIIVDVQGSAKRLQPGCVDAAGKLRQGKQQQENLAKAF